MTRNGSGTTMIMTGSAELLAVGFSLGELAAELSRSDLEREGVGVHLLPAASAGEEGKGVALPFSAVAGIALAGVDKG